MSTIVYMLPDADAGVASVVRNLLRYQSSRNRTKVILMYNETTNPDRRIKDDLNGAEIHRISYHPRWTTKRGLFSKIASKIDSSCVIVSNGGGFEIEFLRFIPFALPVIFILHGTYPHYYRTIEAYAKNIGLVVTVSDYLKQEIGRMNVGVQIESIKFPVPKVELPNSRVNTEVIRIVFIGSLIKEKGVFDLVKIIQKLEQYRVPFNLNIIGSGPEESVLRDELQDIKGVRFLGQLSNSEVLSMHHHHDILLLPSRAEGLPVVIVEAMKCGVVPLASEIKSGIPECIEHSFNGYMIQISDIESYARYINDLHLNRDLLALMSERSIIKANKIFDPISQAKKYEDAFTSVPSSTHFMRIRLSDYLPLILLHRIKSFWN